MQSSKTTHQPPLDSRAAAEYLGLTPGYLAKLRVWGGGPVYIKGRGLRGAIKYDPSDLKAWQESRKRISTSRAA